MDLYILRHGIAVDPGTQGYKKDSERPLTEEGREQMVRITEAMKKLKLSWDVILSSPFIRAKQTAEIVAANLGLKNRLEFSNHLACGADPAQLIEQIQVEFPEAERVLIVGHEPYLSGLIGFLVSGRHDSEVTMKKAGLCKLTIDHLQYKRCAVLEWLLTPKQMLLMTND